MLPRPGPSKRFLKINIQTAAIAIGMAGDMLRRGTAPETILQHLVVAVESLYNLVESHDLAILDLMRDAP